MKKISFFALALAAGLMMGCSDEVGNDVNPGGTGSATVGEGFMSVAINLPSTTGGSRASVDGFDDGLPNEYEVKDGKLYIFGGASLDAATLQASYDLDVSGFNTTGTTTDQITSTAVLTVSTKTMSGANFYPVVVLNTNGQTLNIPAKSTIKQLEAQTLKVSENTLRGKGFMMTNSPLSQVPGGVTQPASVTIMKYPSFTADAIKSTAADAAANPAATIYVERIHAKVTLAPDPEGLDSPDEDEFGEMSILGWALDNTNTETFLIRNVANDSPWWAYKNNKVATTEYRFIEDALVATGLYRTYWGIDPNYDKAGSFNKMTSFSDKYGKNNPQYCLENTFNTDNQNVNQTTAVIVKAQFNNGEDFYIVNGNKSDAIDEAGAKAQFATKWQEYLEEKKDGLFTGTFPGSCVDVTLSTTAGKVSATKITLKDPTGQEGFGGFEGDNTLETLQAMADAQLATINSKVNVELYEDGISYYRLLIKHFGDIDTPWEESDKVNGDSYADPSGTTGENQWLGRYGMVRNNWYDLNVTGARELGSATVPDVSNTPDDDVNNLAVTINILSWAKRTQNVEL